MTASVPEDNPPMPVGITQMQQGTPIFQVSGASFA